MRGDYKNPIKYEYKTNVSRDEAIAQRDRLWNKAENDVAAGKVICLSDLIGASENVILCTIDKKGGD
jgi:hypothetical protein